MTLLFSLLRRSHGKEFLLWIQKNINFLYFLLDTFVRMRYNEGTFQNLGCFIFINFGSVFCKK